MNENPDGRSHFVNRGGSSITLRSANKHGSSNALPSADTEQRVSTQPGPSVPNPNHPDTAPITRPNRALPTIFENGYLIANKDSEIPFKHVKVLGNGHSAFVDEVEHQPSGWHFARKTYKMTTRDLESLQVKIRNEFDILQRLSTHHHILDAVAWYSLQTTSRKELAIITHPVADGGCLEYFLEHFRNSTEKLPSDETTLLHSLGCLIGTLEFTHTARIRHKDIKPANILLHGRCLLLADFGIAFDCSQLDYTTTTGDNSAFTWRYTAPEFTTEINTSETGGSRNRKSDVFSLGCTLIEILATLNPNSVPVNPWKKGDFMEVLDWQNPDSTNNTLVTRYAECADRIVENITYRMETGALPTDIPKVVYQALCKMLISDQYKRCSAEEALQIFQHEQALFCRACFDMNRWAEGKNEAKV